MAEVSADEGESVIEGVVIVERVVGVSELGGG